MTESNSTSSVWPLQVNSVSLSSETDAVLPGEPQVYGGGVGSDVGSTVGSGVTQLVALKSHGPEPESQIPATIQSTVK